MIRNLNYRETYSKATSIISIAGAVSSLLFGFGTFLLTRMEPSYELVGVAMIILGVAVVLDAISVGLAFWASRIRKYQFVMTTTRKFFQQEQYTTKEIKQAKNYNVKEIEKFMHMTHEEFNDMIIHDHLSCIKLNSETNRFKAKLIMAAQITFLTSLVLIPILLFIVFQAFNASAFR